MQHQGAPLLKRTNGLWVSDNSICIEGSFKSSACLYTRIVRGITHRHWLLKCLFLAVIIDSKWTDEHFHVITMLMHCIVETIFVFWAKWTVQLLQFCCCMSDRNDRTLLDKNSLLDLYCFSALTWWVRKASTLMKAISTAFPAPHTSSC